MADLLNVRTKLILLPVKVVKNEKRKSAGTTFGAPLVNDTDATKIVSRFRALFLRCSVLKKKKKTLTLRIFAPVVSLFF